MDFPSQKLLSGISKMMGLFIILIRGSALLLIVRLRGTLMCKWELVKLEIKIRFGNLKNNHCWFGSDGLRSPSFLHVWAVDSVWLNTLECFQMGQEWCRSSLLWWAVWRAEVYSGAWFLKHGWEHVTPFIFVKFWTIITLLSLGYGKTKVSEWTGEGFFLS